MKINLYDFDNTIYEGDSSTDFFFYCLKRYPKIAKIIPKILLSAIKHTLHITLFIFIITLIINTIFTLLGDNYLSKILLNNSILSPFITSLIGLIPNCASSVILTELFIEKVISMPILISGLCVNAGVGLLVLFKTNENKKENLKIIGLLYAIGVISGLILEIII